MIRLAPLIALLCSACVAGTVDPDGDGAPPPDDGGAPDLAARAAPDLAAIDLASPAAEDLGGADLKKSGPGPKPNGGAVGPNGGTVDRLFFTFHGDTRPPRCDDTPGYPTKLIDAIFAREAKLDPEFGIDVGDHMFVCQGSLTEAQNQMGLYTKAAKGLGRTLFMTMGNHECGQGYCLPGNKSPNYAAFMAALKPVSGKPYYSFDVTTDAGLATFVIVADNAWDADQSDWLTATLTKADASARYTIVSRHHPIDNTDLPTMQDEWNLIRSHKYTLFLTGHTHEYKHDTKLDPSRRTVRMGNAGAPLNNNFPYFGFGTVQQGLDDRLYVTVYDEATGNATDSWSVPPQ